LELTFSEGVISALRETEGVHMIQTSAPISPGSSGGGLFDAKGNLVGITTFYLKEGQSLNFALPGEWLAEATANLAEADAKSSTSPSDAELESRAWIKIGLEAVEKEEYNLAGHALRKCADLKQSDASRAWLELGNLAERAKYLDSTSDAYKAWFREHEWSPKEGLANSITAFENAIELKPDYAEAWRGLAGVHIDRGEYERAISAAKEATRLAPGDWNGWLLLGECYWGTGPYDQLIDAWQRAEKVAPSDKKSLMLSNLGFAYAKRGDREQVLRIYQQLKSIDPKRAEDFFKLAVLPTR
jgi:tetratricopeptide (TPR) repeat protein